MTVGEQAPIMGSGHRNTAPAYKRPTVHGLNVEGSAVLSGTGQVRDVVSRSRGAIGYISLGFVDSVNAKTSVKAVSVNHVEASEKTVASGGYPISRDLYFFVKGAPSRQAQDYIDYVTSEKMDKQIREAGFIPVTNDEKGSE